MYSIGNSKRADQSLPLPYSRLNPSSTPSSRASTPPRQGSSTNGGGGGGTGDPSSAYSYSTTLRRQSLEDESFSLSTLAHLAGNVAGSVVSHAFHPNQDDPSGNSRPNGSAILPLSTTDSSGAIGPGANGSALGHHPTPSARFSRHTIPTTLTYLQTSSTSGLSSSSVSQLLSQYGPNEFQVAAKDPTWKRFLGQFWESPLILLLMGSALVSALVGNLDDCASILMAVTIVVTVGFVQEQRSEQSLEALNKLVPHYCHLIRDSRASTPLANILLPGDLVSFSVGDRVPADVRIISSVNLEIDESNLTGESKPAKKTSEPTGGFEDNPSVNENGGNESSGFGGDGSGSQEGGRQGGSARRSSSVIVGSSAGNLDISEMKNIAFMGTLVKSGRGRGIVVGTGKDTEFGRVFEMMQEVQDRKTPLQISMDELAKKLSIISFGVIGVICLIGVWQRRSWLEMFTIGVSLAVAAIPEGLPIVVTVTLALGVLRMSKRKAIVKKLPCVETLGSVSVICSDKTGTLTTNQMTVSKAYSVESEILDLSKPVSLHSLDETQRNVFLIGNLCNHSIRNNEGINVGQATEVALINVLRAIGMEDQRPYFHRRSDIPFNSEQKWASVTGTMTNISTSKDTIYMAGMLEAILARSRFFLRRDGSTSPLDDSSRQAIVSKAYEVASSGLRVVAMAMGPDVDSLAFAGFQAMSDPPRVGVDKAIAKLTSAGVQVVMITGDSEQTAVSISRQLGLPIYPGTSGCLTGKDIDMMTPRQLQDRIGGISVFARTTPRHKMAIVEAFQARGGVVAMTGDGVNDAPALKLADIGISMGKGGTDVAKEAADVILVDDNFATIVPAVEEGKSIFYNIQNFLAFQLSTAVAALSLITLSTALELPTPLNPMQILFINILMDGPPSQSLGVDPVNREVMRRPPRSKHAPVLSRRLLYRVLFSASMIIFGVLFIYARELTDGKVSARDQTMTFTTFVFLDLVSALQNRGLTCAIPQNRMLITTVSISFIVQLLLVYFPPLQAVFQTEALSMRDLGVLLTLAGCSMGLHQARRWWEVDQDRRRSWSESAV